MRKYINQWMVVLFSGILIASILITTLPTTAMAAASDPDSAIEKKNAAALKKLFLQRKVFQRVQDNRLSDADSLVAEVQNRIVNYQNRGVDTTALEAALSTFQARLAEAKTYQQNAADLISAHPGFGGSSEVTDLSLARQTVKNLIYNQTNSYKILTTSLKKFNTAYNNFQKSNRK